MIKLVYVKITFDLKQFYGIYAIRNIFIELLRIISNYANYYFSNGIP